MFDPTYLQSKVKKGTDVLFTEAKVTSSLRAVPSCDLSSRELVQLQDIVETQLDNTGRQDMFEVFNEHQYDQH